MAMLSRAQNLLRLTLRPSQPDPRDVDLETGLSSTSYFKDTIYTDLYDSMVKSRFRGNNLQCECWKWYCSYLDASIRAHWEKTLQGVIRGLDPKYPREAAEWPLQASNIYRTLKVVADAISSRVEVSIDGIIAELRSKDFIRSGAEDGGVASENEIRQMVWCLIGIITMLYDAKPQLGHPHLKLRQPNSNLRRAGRNSGCTDQQDIGKSEDPLHALLAQFGDILPKVQVDERYLASAELDYINIAYINFYTLKYVAKLEIEWVNTLSLHLQLDKRRRVLRLFRFPATCHLLWTQDEESFMSQLFTDHRKSQVDANLHGEHRFSDYLREVILSYRLLFGIDEKSRKAFQKELPAWRAGLRRGISSTDNSTTNTRIGSGCFAVNPSIVQHIHHPNRQQSSLQQHPYDSLRDDPLLLLLCTTTTTSQSASRTRNWLRCGGFFRKGRSYQDRFSPSILSELLRSLHGEEKSGLYDLEDFPFLGRRLAEIQHFSQKQKPNDWKSLFWVDRRDPQSFWNFWIAWVLLIIGGGTIVLQFWQLIFQIVGDFRSP